MTQPLRAHTFYTHQSGRYIFLFWLQSLSYSSDGEKSPHVRVKGRGFVVGKVTYRSVTFRVGGGMVGCRRGDYLVEDMSSITVGL